MVKHPRYLDIPWAMHWYPEKSPRHYRWWVFLAVLAALVLIGVGVASARW